MEIKAKIGHKIELKLVSIPFATSIPTIIKSIGIVMRYPQKNVSKIGCK